MIPVRYAWFIWSVSFLVVWAVMFIRRPSLRKKMFWMSVWTTPLGITQAFFSMEYWYPPSAFDPARTKCWDIETFIYSFAVGGVAAALHDFVFGRGVPDAPATEARGWKTFCQTLAVVFPFLLFAELFHFTMINVIYCALIAKFAGSLAAMGCQPRIAGKIIVGGAMFLALHVCISFAVIKGFFPDFVNDFYRLPQLSGIMISGFPVEEYCAYLGCGMLWTAFGEYKYSARFFNGAIEESTVQDAYRMPR